MDKYKLTNNIRKLRFYHNEMTQQELTIKTGVSRQTIVAVENCKYSPSLELAFKTALFWGVKLEEVFEYKNIEKSEENE